MNHAGAVLLAVAALWIAYLVPHRLRFRQQLLESRADDRFSEGLRVLRVARPARADARRTEQSTTRVLLHPRRAGGGGPMDRPHGATDRVVADAARRVAAERAHRVAHLARRRAAARRRGLLTAALVVVAVVTWVVVGVASAPVLVAAAPTAALAGVLLLGRRAAVQAAAADAAWAEGAATRASLPSVTAGARTVGRAVRPSDAQTEVIRRVPSRPASRPDARLADERSRPAGRTAPRPTAAHPTGRDGHAPAAPGSAQSGTGSSSAAASADASPTSTPSTSERAPAATAPSPATRTVAPSQATWSPVPVPRPAYTLKPSAPRREPAPLPEPTPVTAEPAATPAATTEDVAPAARADAAPVPLDLDAILARRRAAGE